MLSLVRIAYLWLTVLVLAIFVVLLLAVDGKPKIRNSQSLKSTDITRAKRILDGTLFHQYGTSVNNVSLTESDLNVASNYLLKRYFDGAAQVNLQDGIMICRASLKLPSNALGQFLNLKFRLKIVEHIPIIKELVIGSIRIPQEFAGWAVEYAIDYSSLGNFHLLVNEHIKQLEIDQHAVSVTYRSHSRRANGTATAQAIQTNEESLIAFHDRLVEITRDPKIKRYLPLSSMMDLLFGFAYERSKIRNPIDENRALLIVLAAYVHRQTLAPLITHGHHLARPRRHLVFLNGRIDAAQHFTASAALTVSSDSDLAEMVGLYKEITDTHFGSGFSFTDLAADQAGARFGRFAIESEEKARMVQRLMKNHPHDRLYMPQANDLPENLKLSQFKQQFEKINSVAYNEVIRKIEARISKLKLYREDSGETLRLK